MSAYVAIDNQLGDKELEQAIIDALKSVYDPEIPVNIYDLGLIYTIRIFEDRTVYVQMTLTAPGCPVAGTLPGQVEMRLQEVPGIQEACVELTFDPPYTLERMSDEARLALGWM